MNKSVSLDGLQPEFRQRLEALLSESGDRLYVRSAFRSYSEQKALYDRYVHSGFNKKFLAAKPGISNHEKGLAADIDPNPGGTYDLLHFLGAKYGFHFPISGEQWHAELSPSRKPFSPHPTAPEASTMINKPAVKVLPTLTGQGYYIVAADGGVFSFGDAKFYGAMDRPIDAPIVDAALSASGKGYYLVGADGGIFTYGDALFFGSAKEYIH